MDSYNQVMKYLFIILFSISFNSESQGSCETRDLNEGGPFKNMPIYDQDGTGLCYAYAASQLISYELRNDNSGTTLDPSPLALSAEASGTFNQSLDGGKLRLMIKSANDYGIRKYSCVKELASKFGDTEAVYSHVVHKIAEMHKGFLWFTDKPSREMVLERLNEDPFISGSFCNIAQVYDDLVSRNQLFDTAPEILKKLVGPCPLIPVKEFEYNQTISGNDDNMTNQIDEALDQFRPAGIAFCSRIFQLPGHYPPPNNSPSIVPRSTSVDIKPCESHAAVVTAKRMSSYGECEYLIRNSWGSHWKPDGFSCACRLAQIYFPDCPTYEGLKERFPNQTTQFLADAYESRVYVGCWIKKGQLAPTLKTVGSLK